MGRVLVYTNFELGVRKICYPPFFIAVPPTIDDGDNNDDGDGDNDNDDDDNQQRVTCLHL
jgi:hypothetical protein